MTCDRVRPNLLMRADAEPLPTPLAEHVAGCAACAAVLATARRADALVVARPVPPPTGRKADFLATLDGPVIVPAVRPVRRPGWSVPRVGWKPLAGLAAGLLVVVGGWRLVSWSNAKPEVVAAPQHPLLDRLVRQNVVIARAATPHQRLEALAGMAGEIDGQFRDLAAVAGADELRDLAGWYAKAAGGLVTQARALPAHPLEPAEAARRTDLLDKLAGQLEATAAAADELGRRVPPAAQPAVRRIGDMARDGHKALRAAARGEGA